MSDYSYDFSFNNSVVKEYFYGTGPAPVSELLYLHTHPLIRPNFLTIIDDRVKEAGKVIVDKKIGGAVVGDFMTLAVALGKHLPSVTEDNAIEVLDILKRILTLSDKVISS